MDGYVMLQRFCYMVFSRKGRVYFDCVGLIIAANVPAVLSFVQQNRRLSQLCYLYCITKRQNYIYQMRFGAEKCTKKVFSAKVPPRISLVELTSYRLTALSRPLAGLRAYF